jgi:hypothetical protein
MHFLLNPETIAAIVTVALTALAGTVGYFIRERATRARPFVAILEINGEVISRTKSVEVPQAIADALRQSMFFRGVGGSSTTLDKINDALSDVTPFIERGPALLANCQKIIQCAKAGQQDSAQAALFTIFNTRQQDDAIALAIGSGMVAIPAVDNALPVLVPSSYEQTYDDGCYSIQFMDKSTTIARNLNQIAIVKQRVWALVQLVERLELAKLANVFTQIEKHIQEAIGTAKDAAPILRDVLDQNSQWSFKIYTANLGITPFLIAPGAQLAVEDTTGAKYFVPCDLLILSENADDGAEVNRKTNAPMILRAQSDTTFGLVTARVQAEMEHGAVLRAVFRNAKAQCRFHFQAEQVGFSRQANFASPEVPFRQT